MPEPQTARQVPIDGVGCVVAVVSGKGGVGKSTVAVNLAAALAATGKAVGLADMDIYGPSAPVMLGRSERPGPGQDDLIGPVMAHGLKVMSMGFFLDDSAPVVWRGPMVMSATKQFLRGVRWSPLDHLIVDLPPGTGDAILTLAQEVPLDGAVLVTTPQDVALDDVTRSAAMLGKVNVPLLGVVDNMAGYACDDCGTVDEIFGSRETADIEELLGAPLLARIPIVPALAASGDSGTPLVISDPQTAASVSFAGLATRVEQAVTDGQRVSRLPEPSSIEHESGSGLLRIEWSDGETTAYRLRGLRGWCPCAMCQGHGGGRNFVDVVEPQLSSFEGVGRYGLRLLWSDGHSTGMYPYGYLRELASYPECRP